jgi:rSAM-partnered protein
MTDGDDSRRDNGDDSRVDDSDEWHRVDSPRADGSREWEVFLRESAAESLRHVGSLSAPSEELALEQATTLFDHAAETIWLCPADETRRFRTRQLGADHVTDTDSERATNEDDERVADTQRGEHV